MKRPLALSILAVLYWLEAASLVLFGLVLWLWVWLAGQGVDPAADMPAEAAELMHLLLKMAEEGALPVLVGLFLLFAALFVWFGIGLWKLRNWARRVTIALMILRLLFLAPGLVIGLLRADLLGLGLQLLFVAVYGWILWYLYQPPIKQLFTSTQPSSQSLSS
jgi:uncharacterized protein YacL